MVSLCKAPIPICTILQVVKPGPEKKHQAEVRNLGCGCSPVQARYCI